MRQTSVLKWVRSHSYENGFFILMKVKLTFIRKWEFSEHGNGIFLKRVCVFHSQESLGTSLIETFNPDSIYPPSDVVYQINNQFNTPEERLNVDKQYV